MSISMEDVARRAGASKSTVSLVLNERPGVSEEMRQRVQEAARALGYRLPPQRRDGPSGEGLTHAPVIALVHCVGRVPDVDSGLTHLYLSYRNGIQRYAQGRELSVMLVTSYRDDNGDSLSHELLSTEQRALDGLVLMGAGLQRESRLVQRVLAEGIPTVILGRSWPDLPISSVSQDHREQARLVLTHLLGLGHRHVGFVAREIDRDYDWLHARLQVYREVMAEQVGMDHDYVSIAADVDQAVAQLLDRHPQVTGIFALNDHLACQAIRSALSWGRRVPDTLSVVGVDGTMGVQEGLPRLTTVAFPHEEVGYLAAELLLEQMRNLHLRNGNLTVRSELVEGASAGPPSPVKNGS